MTLLGCADANPNAQGGQPILDGATPAASADTGPSVPPTWTALYAAVFGPSGSSNCGNSNCHAASGGSAIATAVWTCGASQEDCYTGMVAGTLVTPNDAGISDPTKTQLYAALHRPDCKATFNSCNMPLNGDALAAGDVVSISLWIQQGAPDN